MVKFIIILLVFFLLPRKASADIGSLFGGSDAPEYRQISPESTMTESQKAMQQYLTALGKLGYEKGTKAFDPERAKRSNAFYNATLSAIQGGGMGMNPRDINAAVAQTMEQQPTQTTGSNAEAKPFVPDELLENASKYMNAIKDQRGAGSMGGDPRSQEITRNAVPGSDTPYGKAAFALSQKTITPEMIEAYAREKKAAEEAAMLAKYRGGK